MKHGMLSLILIVATNLRAQQPPIVSFFPFSTLRRNQPFLTGGQRFQ
jgi:hypothetical protein